MQLSNKGNLAIRRNTDEPSGQYTMWKEPVTEGQMLYHSIYMRILKESDSLKWGVEWWLPGP